MSGWLGRNWFLLGLAAAVGLAFLVPALGARGGPLRPELTTDVGVAVIFLIQGLIISPAALATGALRWRLHVTVQLIIFAAFPLAMLVLDAVGGRLLPPELRLGFLFLAILPTTVSTCVVFTSTAGGNASGALFNAALANMAGAFLTPLLAAALLSARGAAPPLGSLIGEVALLLVAPLAIGQAVRPLVRRIGEPSPRVLGVVTNAIILYMIFIAFAGSVGSGAFASTAPVTLLGVGFAALGIFVAATAATAVLGRALGFDTGDRLALLFCGPQKTLAAGAPMGQILFAGNPALGLILLPMIVYHAVQLIGGAVIAQRHARARRAAPPPAEAMARAPQR